MTDIHERHDHYFMKNFIFIILPFSIFLNSCFKQEKEQVVEESFSEQYQNEMKLCFEEKNFDVCEGIAQDLDARAEVAKKAYYLMCENDFKNSCMDMVWWSSGLDEKNDAVFLKSIEELLLQKFKKDSKFSKELINYYNETHKVEKVKELIQKNLDWIKNDPEWIINVYNLHDEKMAIQMAKDLCLSDNNLCYMFLAPLNMTEIGKALIENTQKSCEAGIFPHFLFSCEQIGLYHNQAKNVELAASMWKRICKDQFFNGCIYILGSEASNKTKLDVMDQFCSPFAYDNREIQALKQETCEFYKNSKRPAPKLINLGKDWIAAKKMRIN